jgi:hypothetical protein
LASFPKSRYAQAFAVFLAFVAGLVYTGLLATTVYEGSLGDVTFESMATLDGLHKV